MNVLYRLRDARRGAGQELGIRGKEPDDDGLRLAGKVANHVLQNLHELDFGGGLRLLNLLSNVIHDFLNAPLAIALELHGEIAAIRFGNCGQP